MDASREFKLKVFGKLFADFISDLHALQPNDWLLALARPVLNVIRNEDLVKQFMDCVGEYTEEIYNKNEEFFINELPSLLNNSLAAGELKRVSKIWNDPLITQKDKDNIWKYLTSLSKLGESLRKK